MFEKWRNLRWVNRLKTVVPHRGHTAGTRLTLEAEEVVVVRWEVDVGAVDVEADGATVDVVFSDRADMTDDEPDEDEAEGAVPVGRVAVHVTADRRLTGAEDVTFA